MIGCTLHGMTPRVTLEKIPLDVLCDIWEVFGHVEHLTCERVSDPQQVCLVLFLADEYLCTCSTLPAGVIDISYCLLSPQQHPPLIFCFTAFLNSLHVSCTASFFYSSVYLSAVNVPHISLSLFTVGTNP